METYVKNKELVIVLKDRIDYINVRDVEAEIFDAVKEHPGLPLCLDADKLLYISSAGLRVMMKLRKECAAGFSIRNVCPEVYEIFDMTGLTGIIDVRKKPRRFETEGLPVIGKGASGTVYRLDEETVIKVYEGGEEMLPVIEEEQEKAKKAFLSGLPNAIPYDVVRVGDGYGAVFEMINARNLSDIVREEPSGLPEIIPRYAAFIKTLNSTESYEGQLPAAKDIYLEALKVIGPYLSGEVLTKIRSLLEELPEDRHLVHGDIQLKNVMLSGDEMMLIDMDHLCTGNPVFEFAALYVTYVALSEVDSCDTLHFLGLDRETCAALFYGTLREYMQLQDESARCEQPQVPEEDARREQPQAPEDALRVQPQVPDENALRMAERKIRTAGYLRLLKLILVEGKIADREKSGRCIEHAVSRLEELAFEVEGLAV